ncbi:MFS transporter permease [Massilia sp. WF1]|uniref:MFS transporter n=1 Tax=unclassified Massilia TaxID=2609279 RepID=UPI00064A03EB|nr:MULTISPECIES: MFS transporter [unclassified Massilia]ALK99207.1 MFS transporter permease [Massilia sp. WG5]KLU35073.1 MFS transporter permease [Massilia sp. WF1]
MSDINHNARLEADTIRKVTWRLIPFLMLCYLLAFIDRGNIGMAALQMNDDLGLTKKMFGFAGSLFFISYFLFEVPSNLALQKFGARKWIARIMITWGLVSAGMALVQGANSLYVMRFLLGAAEAGFFPGVVLYLTYWFPAAYRARIVAIFMVAVPMASFVGSPLSALLLQADGLFGLRGWHWLFILEGIPTVLMGFACLVFLTDRPEQAKWLSEEQRNWLSARIEKERNEKKEAGPRPSIWQLLRSKEVLGMALVCSTASAAGSVLGVWQPQLLKSFGLTIMQTGMVNSIPYVIAAVLMVWWGRHSDRKGERRWHTAIPLALISGGMLSSLFITSLAPTVVLLSCVLIGAYSFKGPFWALSSSWLASGSAAAGLAAINAASNLIGGGLMVNVYGWIKEGAGSHSLALLPIAILALASIVTLLVLSNDAHKATRNAATKAAA